MNALVLFVRPARKFIVLSQVCSHNINPFCDVIYESPSCVFTGPVDAKTNEGRSLVHHRAVDGEERGLLLRLLQSPHREDQEPQGRVRT